MTPADETAWVVRAQCGDRNALELLLRRVQPPIHRYVSRIVGSTSADDVTQEVLIAIARKLGWLVEPRVFRAWMFRIASRAAFTQLRRHRRQAEDPLGDDVLDGADALPAPPASPDSERLRELLDSSALSPRSRAVLLLHFQEEMPLAEVAAVLELPLGTVKSRLAFGLKTLRREIGRSG